MSMHSAYARLKRAEKELIIRWELTQSAWQDENARKFAKDRLDPLLDRVHAAHEAMVHLETILTTVRHECG